MDSPLYPHAGAETERKHHEFAPMPLEAIKTSSASVFTKMLRLTIRNSIGHPA